MSELDVPPRSADRDRARIVVITRTFPKLSETFVTDHVRALREAGHDVTVVARRIDRARLEAEFGVTIAAFALPSWGRLGPAATLAAVCGALAWLGRHRPLAPRRAAWKHALYGQRLRAVLAALEPDLVHAHFGPSGIDAGIALDGASTPLACNFHGFDATSFPRAHGWALYRAALARATLVAHSDFMERQLVENGLPRPQRVRLGVDRALFRARLRAARWAAPVRLVTVGRLERKKGQALAVETLAQLRRRVPHLDFRLRLIGAGSQAEPLRRQVETLGLGAFVEGPAPASHAEVAAALEAADLALVPSRVGADGWQESFCRVVIEAMACGLPVVATPTGGLPDTVDTGGTIAAGTTADALADAVLATIERHDPAEWQRRVTARAAEFDISRMDGDYVALAERLLGR